MSWQGIQFIRHYISSNSRHGTHSPFVYELVSNCIYASSPSLPDEYSAHFEQLKHRHESVEGMDHGKGAPMISSVSKRARRSAVPKFQAELLHRLTSYFQPMAAVELGSNLGHSLAAMALGHRAGQFTGVEGNADLVAIANDQLSKLKLSNAVVVHDAFDQWLDQNKTKWNLVFLDGDHHLEPTLKYVHKLIPFMEPEGVLILHDIYWSKEMMEAWKTLQNDLPQAVFVDLFFFGLILLDRPQAGESFKIRFPPGWLFF